MRLAERVAASQVTDDLGESRNIEDIADVDVIRACGIIANKHPMGLSVWRLKYSKDTREITKVMKYLIEWVLSEKLVEDNNAASDLVKASMKHWFDPVCDNCNGLGYLKVTGAPMLSDHACSVCRGTGQIKIDDEIVKEVLQHLNKLERITASQIFTKLND